MLLSHTPHNTIIFELNIKINSVNFNSDTLFSKTLLVISALNYLLIIAALYFFRKILNYFIRVKIFEETVIKSFKKTGNLLSVSGIISLTVSMISKIYFDQKLNKLTPRIKKTQS